jgi:hypothetical protein
LVSTLQKAVNSLICALCSTASEVSTAAQQALQSIQALLPGLISTLTDVLSNKALGLSSTVTAALQSAVTALQQLSTSSSSIPKIQTNASFLSILIFSEN